MKLKDLLPALLELGLDFDVENLNAHDDAIVVNFNSETHDLAIIIPDYEPEVTIVHGEEWDGVYLNGSLIVQGHNLNWGLLVDELGGEPAHVAVDNDWLADHGCLADSLYDNVFAEET